MQPAPGSAAVASAPGSARPRVLLTTEGTYPHSTGAVSTWAHLLVNGLTEVDFTIWALTAKPFVRRHFRVPGNVRAVTIPLWGADDPSWSAPWAARKGSGPAPRRTAEHEAGRGFLPLFHRFLDLVTGPEFEPQPFADLLLEMQRYFRVAGYRATWRSPVVWEAFRDRLLARPDPVAPPFGEPLSLDRGSLWRTERAPARPEPDPSVPTAGEAIEALRWMYRMLVPLNLEIPAVDVVHASSAGFSAIPCIVAKGHRGTPFLLTEHGVYLREQYLALERARYPYQLKHLLMRTIQAVVITSYRLADQVSPVCAFNARWERAHGVPASALRVIYNGVDENEFRPMRVARSERPTVVSISRIDPVKDVLTMLWVADRIRREVRDVLFVHHGPVSDRGYWATVRALHRELELEGTVEFRGPTDTMAEAINGGDVVLVTSTSESLPYSVLGALMCGKPVVATAVGGLREALVGTGVTAPVGDAGRLAEGVLALLRLPREQRARLAEAARERALGSFTLSASLEAYRDSYRSLAGMRPASATVVIGEADDVTLELGEASREPAAERPAGRAPTLDPPIAPEEDPAPPVAAGEGPDSTGPEPAPPEAPGFPREILRAALADHDPFVRVGAISLASGSDALEPVLAALRDDYPQVRREAVRALERLGGSEVARALITVVAQDPSAEVREEAVAALAVLLGRSAKRRENGA